MNIFWRTNIWQQFGAAFVMLENAWCTFPWLVRPTRKLLHFHGVTIQAVSNLTGACCTWMFAYALEIHGSSKSAGQIARAE
jgi:hypothetical protein